MALDPFQFQIDKSLFATQIHYFLKGTKKPAFNVGTLLIAHIKFVCGDRHTARGPVQNKPMSGYSDQIALG
jgi:hypothetical protein